MSKFRVGDFVVCVLAGAAFVVALSSCQTSKHTEAMDTEGMPAEEVADIEVMPEPVEEPSMAEDMMVMEEIFAEEEIGPMSSLEDSGIQELAPSDIMDEPAPMQNMDPSSMTDRDRMEQDGENFGLSHVFFAYNKYAISDEAALALQANARMLKGEHQGADMVIEGHCDERGTADYNMELGKRRAQAVKNYLADLGIQESRVRVVSYGKERPFCLESDPACWAQNRRGHFLLQK